jgi:hypothetical protein
MGILGIHAVGQIDVVPKSIEYCIDTSISTQLGNCDPSASPLGIPVYAPVSGCAIRVQADVIILVINCESQNTYPAGRREIAFTHLDPDTIQQWPLLTFSPVTVGDLIGNLCRDVNKSSCNITGQAATHLAISLRFYNFTTSEVFTAAQDEEVLGFNAIPSCLFDDWLNVPGMPTPNPTPLHACPLP